jgi:hypothetical protein
MTEATKTPLVLLDEPEDLICERTGWVEATVSVAMARELLMPYCVDSKSGDNPARPCGEPKRVWLHVAEPGPYPDEDRWTICEPDAKGAREFYAFDTEDCEAV